MKLPLTLPLDSYPTRTITLAENPPGWVYPRVLQIELLHEAEAIAVQSWLSSRSATKPAATKPAVSDPGPSLAKMVDLMGGAA